MPAHLGFMFLLLALIFSLYGFGASIAAAWLRHRRLYRSGRMAATMTAMFIVLAAVVMWLSLFARDYSIAYVWRNSSNDLPAFYTFTTFWSALEGSHFLWMMILAIFTVIALWTGNRDNEHIMPWVAASLLAVVSWMLYLAVSHSDPFVMQLPAPTNGLGKNPLLQNPYMAIHPPTLFTGYTALAIPFAYAIAAMAYGDITEGWLKTTRRWTLFAWCALTAGVALGGHWAYVELGWAGYWAWDPVENSSFMPWLMATALLHSMVIQDKLGHLKRSGIILAILAFFFSFFGTFITRSGIITSVHSFADGNIGPNYLIFIASLLVGSLALFAFRAPSILPPDAGKVWGVSKESALIVTQFLLLTLAAVVFIGTVFPIVSEAVSNQRISIQAPYFNAFAPWIGLAMIVAIAMGNLLRYHSAKIPGGRAVLINAAVIAILPAALFCWRGEVFKTTRAWPLGAQIVGIYLVMWSVVCLCADFRQRLAPFANVAGGVFARWAAFLRRNTAYTGAFVAHIGVLLAILGFLGNYRGVDREVTLRSGETASLFGYDFTMGKFQVREEGNATLYEAPLLVTRDGREIGTVYPAKSKYPTKPELMNEVGVLGGFWHDLYAVIVDFEKKSGETVTLQLHVNPTVRLVFMSVVIMVLGGIIAAFDRIRGDRSRDVAGGVWEHGSGSDAAHSQGGGRA